MDAYTRMMIDASFAGLVLVTTCAAVWVRSADLLRACWRW